MKAYINLNCSILLPAACSILLSPTRAESFFHLQWHHTSAICNGRIPLPSAMAAFFCQMQWAACFCHLQWQHSSAICNDRIFLPSTMAALFFHLQWQNPSAFCYDRIWQKIHSGIYNGSNFLAPTMAASLGRLPQMYTVS